MLFFTRFGYLVAVFFVIAAFIAGGAGTAFHLSRNQPAFWCFCSGGRPASITAEPSNHPGKPNCFFGLRLEYWGYGLFAFFGVLDAYLSWNSLARNWLAAV